MSIQKQVKFTSLFVVDYNNVMNYGRLPHLRSLPETYPAVNLPADITQWYILRRVKTLLLKSLISFQAIANDSTQPIAYNPNVSIPKQVNFMLIGY